jgi:hypothetical protein
VSGIGRNPSGRLVGIVIMDSWDIIQTRMRAAVKGIDQGGEFCDGHELDEASAALVPDAALGRLSSQDEAVKLIRRLDPKTAGRCICAAHGKAEAGDVPMTRRGKDRAAVTFWRGLFRCGGLFGSESS